MRKKNILIPEGGVFAIPISNRRGVFAQVWTLDNRREIGNCGISNVIAEVGIVPEMINWSDPSIYYGDLNLIIDDEWIDLGWPMIVGFKPAKSPLRDEEPFFRRHIYDLLGWRPEINTFVIRPQANEQAEGIAISSRQKL